MSAVSSIWGEIARSLESRLAEPGFREGDFPELATRALEAAALHRSCTATDIMRQAVELEDSVAHSAASVVLHLWNARGKFEIFAHVWFERFASPHWHDWSGAYTSVSGSSLTAFYTLDGDDPAARLVLGRCRRSRAGLMRPGEVVTVEPGARTIHAIHQLEWGCTNVSIRRSAPGEAATIYRPGVVLKSTPRPLDKARIAALQAWARLDMEGLAAYIERARAPWDLESSFRYACETSFRASTLASKAFLGRVEREHGREVAAQLEAGLRDKLRNDRAGALRSEADTDLRYIIGALYLADDRGDLLELVSARSGDRPAAETLAHALVELARRPSMGLPRSPEVRDALSELALHGELGPGSTVAEALASEPLLDPVWG